MHDISVRNSPHDETGLATGPATLPPARVRARVQAPLRLPDNSRTLTEIVSFHGLVDGREHIAVVLGNALRQEEPLVRIHSECLTGDVLGSARCDCGPQLRECLSLMSGEGGVLLYLRQEGRGIGLYNKLDAYRLQDYGMDTFAANRALNFQDDERLYITAAQMLSALAVHTVTLLSNNPEKIRQLRGYGVTVARRRPTGSFVTEDNHRYLQAKMVFAGHRIEMGR